MRPDNGGDRSSLRRHDAVRCSAHGGSPGDPLVRGPMGLQQPDDSAPEVAPDVIVTPLLAFDDRLHRLGYGAGHYDRAIERLIAKGIAPRLIGMGFDCQRVDHVPDEPHDMPLEAIITETGLHSFPLKG